MDRISGAAYAATKSLLSFMAAVYIAPLCMTSANAGERGCVSAPCASKHLESWTHTGRSRNPARPGRKSRWSTATTIRGRHGDDLSTDRATVHGGQARGGGRPVPPLGLT